MRLSLGRVLAALPLALIAACSSQPDTPGAITADEQRQLNEAAEMLDANSIRLDGPSNDLTAE